MRRRGPTQLDDAPTLLAFAASKHFRTGFAARTRRSLECTFLAYQCAAARRECSLSEAHRVARACIKSGIGVPCLVSRRRAHDGRLVKPRCGLTQAIIDCLVAVGTLVCTLPLFKVRLHWPANGPPAALLSSLRRAPRAHARSWRRAL